MCCGITHFNLFVIRVRNASIAALGVPDVSGAGVDAFNHSNSRAYIQASPFNQLGAWCLALDSIPAIAVKRQTSNTKH